MFESNARPIVGSRQSGSSRTRRRSSTVKLGRPETSLYRRDSTLSDASFLSDVEMAQDEVFSGPMSESIPSSITGFAHRQSRTESVVNFTYFQDEDESSDRSSADQAVVDDDEDHYDEIRGRDETEHGDMDYDLESGAKLCRRKSSLDSEASDDQPFLRHHGSRETDASKHGRQARTRQKIYVLTEDLTIVIAGFSTTWSGLAMYMALCILSGGLAYLVFRWLPRWRIRLVGSVAPLRSCEWVVIEVNGYFS